MRPAAPREVPTNSERPPRPRVLTESLRRAASQVQLAALGSRGRQRSEVRLASHSIFRSMRYAAGA